MFHKGSKDYERLHLFSFTNRHKCHCYDLINLTVLDIQIIRMLYFHFDIGFSGLLGIADRVHCTLHPPVPAVVVEHRHAFISLLLASTTTGCQSA